MDTIILQGATTADIEKAAALLHAGEIVAFPTDTVYGLGANAQDETAVQKIYTAKGRPPEKPLILLIHEQEQLHHFVSHVSDIAQKLMDAFWPGPLTLVFPLKEGKISASVTRGQATIGVRIPNHSVTLQLLQKANFPIAAPSANRSGNPSAVTAEDVANDLNGKIAAIVADGACKIGEASTIVDVCSATPKILRSGAISKAQLEQVTGITIEGGE